jgi:hypothetical protein
MIPGRLLADGWQRAFRNYTMIAKETFKKGTEVTS